MAHGTATSVIKRAQRALHNSPIHALRDLNVEQAGDSLLISGRVETFYHKQLAQEIVRSTAGDLELVNSIDVAYRDPY